MQDLLLDLSILGMCAMSGVLGWLLHRRRDRVEAASLWWKVPDTPPADWSDLRASAYDPSLLRGRASPPS